MVTAMIRTSLLLFLRTYLFLLFLASTLAGHGSLPSGVSQTFIPEGSGPLAVLSVVFHQFILL